jgi:hypothetical protein
VLAVEAFNILRHLDVLVRTRFADDPARVAEWEAARAVRWPKGRAGGGVSVPVSSQAVV